MKIKLIAILLFALLAMACGATRQPEVARADETPAAPVREPSKFYPVKAFPKYSKEEDDKINTVRCGDYFYVTFHGDEGMKIMFLTLITDSAAGMNVFAQRNIKLERDDTLREPQARIDSTQSPPVILRISKDIYDKSPCLQIDLDEIWKEKEQKKRPEPAPQVPTESA
jgi:hypothetical protein